MQWRRSYHVAGKRSLAKSGHSERILRRFAQGKAVQAYRQAVALERHAIRYGDQVLAQNMRSFVMAAGAAREDGEGMSLSGLEEFGRRAAASEKWAEAIIYAAHILERCDAPRPVRVRAQVNYAGGLHTLGRLQEARRAYDAVRADPWSWNSLAPNYRMALLVNREIVQWHCGAPVDWAVLQEATTEFVAAPVTWMGYWWLFSHVAWRTQRSRLQSIRHSSLRTYEQDWPLHYDRVLWGVDLLICSLDSSANTDHAEDRVRSALADEETVKVIGRSAWFDLYTDLLIFLARNRSSEAEQERAKLQKWCQMQGFDGWAAHWQEYTQGDG